MKPSLTMGAVCERTGLTPDVLRAWERRYGAVHPARSEGGHRLFTEEQVRRLELLKRATQSGHRINTLAQLDDESLAELVDGLRGARGAGASGAPTADSSEIDGYLAEAVASIRAMDGEALETLLARSAAELGRAIFTEELMPRILGSIGHEWEAEQITPAHEHLASAAIRSFLGRWTVAFRPMDGAPAIAVATPPGERHEFGALLAATVAAAEGWNVEYLGADLPIADLVEAATLQSVRAVGISVTEQGVSAESLRALREALPKAMTLILGGTGARLLDPFPPEHGRVETVDDLVGFRALLTDLAAY